MPLALPKNSTLHPSPKAPQSTAEIYPFSEKFERCRNIGDIFELVKETTDRALGLRRAGLSLYLADLPPNIGAFHILGSNAIVMNRMVLDTINAMAKTEEDVNAYVYFILLHEYLHSLGYHQEARVRTLSHEISKKSFGPEHKITELSRKGPSSLPFGPMRRRSTSVEVVRDFDRSSQTYIG